MFKSPWLVAHNSILMTFKISTYIEIRNTQYLPKYVNLKYSHTIEASGLYATPFQDLCENLFPMHYYRLKLSMELATLYERLGCALQFILIYCRHTLLSACATTFIGNHMYIFSFCVPLFVFVSSSLPPGRLSH